MREMYTIRFNTKEQGSLYENFALDVHNRPIPRPFFTRHKFRNILLISKKKMKKPPCRSREVERGLEAQGYFSVG